MFSNGDYLTETIAHFIGHFDMAVEEARMRKSYEEFDRQQLEPEKPELPGGAKLPFAAPELAFGYVPEADYGPRHPTRDPVTDAVPFRFDPPIITIPDKIGWTAGDYDLVIQRARAPAFDADIGLPPPSLIFVAQQHKFLFDNDVVVIGDADIPVPPTANSLAAVNALTASAQAVAASLSDHALEMKQDSLAPWVEETMAAIRNTDDATASGPGLTGQWVNGQTTDQAPELIDHLPQRWQEQPVEQLGPDAIAIDASEGPTIMDIETGGNLSLNQATIVNAGLSGTTIAVSGNVYEMDVIVQINALEDKDCADDGMPLIHVQELETTAVNIASFVKQTKDAAADKAEDNPDAMPSSWKVTVVEDDLIFFEWVYQYNLTWDNDSLVMTATGTTTTVSTGGNAGFNGVSFSDLGQMYDLILVGGQLYDVNYITQTNIVYDNDTLSLLNAAADQTGTYTGGGNVLWNQALIQNVGPAGWSQGMPDHYRDAMDRLDNGDPRMPQAFRTDADYLGYSGLNVLYVKGSIFDINYIEQVNVISDADMARLYSDAASQSGDWTISTGSNAAINVAAILDQDSNGANCYVGGESYSESLLIQANLIETEPFTARAPLANEVIAFITEETLSVSDTPEFDAVSAPAYGPTTDVMDSVLA